MNFWNNLLLVGATAILHDNISDNEHFLDRYAVFYSAKDGTLA